MSGAGILVRCLTFVFKSFGGWVGGWVGNLKGDERWTEPAAS
jgi:hypothetical protein